MPGFDINHDYVPRKPTLAELRELIEGTDDLYVAAEAKSNTLHELIQQHAPSNEIQKYAGSETDFPYWYHDHVIGDALARSRKLMRWLYSATPEQKAAFATAANALLGGTLRIPIFAPNNLSYGPLPPEIFPAEEEKGAIVNVAFCLSNAIQESYPPPETRPDDGMDRFLSDLKVKMGKDYPFGNDPMYVLDVEGRCVDFVEDYRSLFRKQNVSYIILGLDVFPHHVYMAVDTADAGIVVFDPTFRQFYPNYPELYFLGTPQEMFAYIMHDAGSDGINKVLHEAFIAEERDDCLLSGPMPATTVRDAFIGLPITASLCPLNGEHPTTRAFIKKYADALHLFQPKSYQIYTPSERLNEEEQRAHREYWGEQIRATKGHYPPVYDISVLYPDHPAATVHAPAQRVELHAPGTQRG